MGWNRRIYVATASLGVYTDSAPYTDSIPNTCGGVCEMGIQSIQDYSYVYTHKVKFE